jgi:hypothetical protein
LNFVFDFLSPKYEIDSNKIVLAGSSMGGSGTSMNGIRNGQIFSNLIGWVGVHNPGKTPVFEGSFENTLGDSAWKCRYSNVEFTAKYGGIEVKPEDNYNVWDYFDNSKWLAKNPTAELPWHTFSNGSNDAAIGWPQAQEYIAASLNYKAPVNFTWGLNGHDQRAQVLAPYGYEQDRNSNLVFRRNQSFPVFTNSSSDDDPMLEEEGQINNYFFWDTESIVDSEETWEISTCLIWSAPIDSVTVDVTPRRLQNLKIEPNEHFLCTYFENDELLRSENLVADENGFVTINNLAVGKNFRRIVLEPLRQQEFQLSAGWCGLSSYLQPVESDIETMFGNLEGHLLYLGNGTEYYMPNLGSNTLNNWDSNSGYFIKISEPASFQITGKSNNSRTVQLTTGWNLIPVLSSVNVPCEGLFSALGTAFVAAVEAAGHSVYWPDLEIYKLQELLPGKSYFIRVNQPVMLDFENW